MSNVVILLHPHRFVKDLFDTKWRPSILGIFGNFSIFLIAAKLRASVFEPVLETLSGILPLWTSSYFFLGLQCIKQYSHDIFVSLCAFKKFCFVDKTLTAFYEYHQSKHSAYRNNQIIHACLAYMSQCLDHRLKNPRFWHCQYLPLLINCLFLSFGKHLKLSYIAQNTNHYASLRHLYSYIYFSLSYFDFEQGST